MNVDRHRHALSSVAFVACISFVSSCGDGGSNLFSAALKSDGTVVSWGYNSQGQLGDGTFTGRSTPVSVCAVGESAPCSSFLDDIAMLSAGGGGDTLALTTDGEPLGWGHNKSAQTGTGDVENAFVPVATPVCEPGGTVPCTSGFDNVILTDASDGTLLAWGYNSRGQLGNDSFADAPAPSWSPDTDSWEPLRRSVKVLG